MCADFLIDSRDRLDDHRNKWWPFSRVIGVVHALVMVAPR